LTAYVEGLQDQVVKWNSTTSTVMTEHLARLTRLVSDLDLVSRVEEHQMELEFSTIQISEFINRAASAIQEKSASKGIALRVESNPTELTVRADYQRLSQVLDNLLSNALRHTPPDESVTIETRKAGTR